MKTFCSCGCGKKLLIPEQFSEGILELQKKYEVDFIFCSLYFVVGHLDKIAGSIEKVESDN